MQEYDGNLRSMLKHVRISGAQKFTQFDYVLTTPQVQGTADDGILLGEIFLRVRSSSLQLSIG